MSENGTSFRDLKLNDIQGMIDGGEYDVVDVREGWEHAGGHIPGSRNVVLSRIPANPQGVQFKDRTIFVCEVGERSAVASEMAVALGGKDRVNFRGGRKAGARGGRPPGEGGST